MILHLTYSMIAIGSKYTGPANNYMVQDGGVVIIYNGYIAQGST